MRGLSQAGVMRASAAELDAAATNVLVLATFWLNSAAVRGDKDENAAIRDGIVQVMLLLAPFLRDAHLVHLITLTHSSIFLSRHGDCSFLLLFCLSFFFMFFFLFSFFLFFFFFFFFF